MAKKQENTEATPEKKPKGRPRKAPKIDVSNVSHSTKRVNFEWSSGEKAGKKESMSENVAEIMELKGLGKKVK